MDKIISRRTRTCPWLFEPCNDVRRPFWQHRSTVGRYPEREVDMNAVIARKAMVR